MADAAAEQLRAQLAELQARHDRLADALVQIEGAYRAVEPTRVLIGMFARARQLAGRGTR